ncbi:MAG: VOC family protein [Vicinamibacterales bacterium]
MEPSISFITLGVADLERSVAFYRDGLGLSTPTSFTLAHNADTAAEVDHVTAQAAAAGGVIVKPAQQTFYGGYAGYFQDPDGHLWEVAYNPGSTASSSRADS